MTIYEKIDGILDSLEIPFYARMPTFAANEEPQLYVVYSLYDTPKKRADGKLLAVQFTITVNIIGTDLAAVETLNSQIISLFENNKIYYSGCNYSSDTDFPQKIRNIMDFVTIQERND